MGGQALKNTATRRYLKDEFLDITPQIKIKLEKYFKFVDMPKYYNDKDSFGDADFICSLPHDNIPFVKLQDFLYSEFNYNELYKNGDVYSFDYKELQVDVILMSYENYDTALKYMAFNDLGNLTGKIFHKFGLKWGHNGLTYVFRTQDKRLGEIVLCTDHRKSLKFIDLCPDRYDKGFNNLQEIFEYVTSSKYFNPEFFKYENLNHQNRVRDKKRSTYSKFLEYVNNMDFVETDYSYFHKDKKVYLGLIDHYFPGFLKKYKELEDKEARKLAISSKFNGHLIMELLPELNGKQLGQCITNLRESFETQFDYDQFILDNEFETIFERFKNINKL